MRYNCSAMDRLAVFLLVCLPAFVFAGLALEPNEAGDLTLFETEDLADSEAVRKLFSVQKNVRHHYSSGCQPATARFHQIVCPRAPTFMARRSTWLEFHFHLHGFTPGK